MARKYFSFRSFHRGTVLFEVLLAAVILSLAALAVIPLYTGWRSEKRLELAAEEVASAIRQVEILAKNEPHFVRSYFIINAPIRAGPEFI